MIKRETLETAMYEAMVMAATKMPPDVEAALRKALENEESELAKQHLRVSLKNAEMAKNGEGLVCGDTGFPLYFVNAGNEAKIEGGFASIYKCAQNATARATSEAYLRPTMVDPLTRENPGNNLGPGMPKVEISFIENSDRLEIVAAPKGGGSEIFGTFYRQMFPADGMAGIKKFVLECIKNGCYAGKICPPAIVGVGIGGTSDLCMKIAKTAAVLRPIGRHNPDAQIAELECELLDAACNIGLGPMGSGGKSAVIAVNIEKAMTHTAALPVAVNAQCLVGRRWRATISPTNEISYSGEVA